MRSSMQRERAVVSGLIALQLVLWLGFAVHRSPRFPGSGTGAVLGISAAVLLGGPSLLYAAVKRIPGLKRRVVARLTVSTLLAWHIYGGIAGAILAILHTGHRFGSPLGTALMGAVFAVVFTGYVGRHVMGMVAVGLREKQRTLGPLVSSYNQLAGTIAARPRDDASGVERRAAELAGSIADLEYAIRMDAVLRRRFGIWLVAHVVSSISFYVLLGLHVWASIHFGLRWLS